MGTYVDPYRAGHRPANGTTCHTDKYGYTTADACGSHPSERLVLTGDYVWLPACLSCGMGTLVGDTYRRCSYCGAGPASFEGTEHVHKLSVRVNGLAECVGRKLLGCTYSDYDSGWGAGLFNDWPRGTHKPYGA